MSGMEFNKIFAAILVAGIIASFAGFVAREFIHPHELEEDAVAIEGVEIVGGPAGPTGPEPILALLSAADIARGEKVSRACAACHTFDKGGANGTGPNLWGVVGSGKGADSGFAYSEDMKSAGGTWDYQALNHFLWKPKSYIPGTKMNFIGLKKPEDRAAMIAWLRSLSDSPAPMPSEAQIAAEQPEEEPENAEAGQEPAPAPHGNNGH